ncbi:MULTISPECIES: MarR family transcriptional regulator [unclassified Arthrobacter]|uniref:MarR family transcriptional regulator n=1 Tax=unclassified Arthrobacter TaxID=235627 RepID=UPI001CFFB82A|nr:MULTISPECIES: MarR family transcriptional regulator [unclassified Arthrobacter]WGZ80731.1 MarR family transcriptional regulator [Arthrobacter sp. EM1]
MMIKSHSDVVLEVTAHHPDAVEKDLNAAVEIAREHAMKECRHGILRYAALDAGALTRLSMLNNSDPQRPSALAERMVTGASNISTSTARLQEAGLVERSDDPRDMRASLIRLATAEKRAGAALRHSGNTLIDVISATGTRKTATTYCGCSPASKPTATG